MNIFITGIEGVLGSVLKKELRRRGHNVRGCGRRHSSDPGVVRADVAEARQLEHAMDNEYDLVFHFAAEFGRKNGQSYYEDLWRTNVIGTRNVIDQCSQRNIPLVFASSSEAYGASELYANGEPLREEMLDENVPQFHSEYALSKYTNERQIFTAARNDGLRAIVLRFFNVYGPPEKFSPYRSVVCQFAWQLLNGLPITVNKTGMRTHLWIGDWVNTVANIADEKRLRRLFQSPNFAWSGAAETPGVPVFNIGGEDYESVKSLYDKLRALLPYSNSVVTYENSEVANSPTKRPDNALAKAYLGHCPMMPMNDGLYLTLEALRKIKKEQ